jgi:CheY-like chemotaxis protein
MSKLVHIVDDDRDLAASLADALQVFGYGAECFPGGPEALERLQRGPWPCVILLDLMMPGMSGWEVCDAITRSPELGAIPIIIMTAASNLAGPLPSGALAVLSKPFELQELVPHLQR